MAENVRDATAIFIRDPEPARTTKDAAVFQACLTDRRRVDDGHHLLEIVLQDAEKERLVSVLERGEVDVFLQVGFAATEIPEGALFLILDAEIARRYETPETQGVDFGFRVGRAFI